MQKSFNAIKVSKNVQLVPKLASTHNKLTLVTAHSRTQNACVECSHNRNF